MLKYLLIGTVCMTLSCSLKPHKSERAPNQLDHIADDVDSPIDASLETSYEDERENSNKLGAVISQFNKDQQKIRQEMLEKVKNEKANEYEKNIVTDLPKSLDQKQAYASRDVHRKTHGCYVGELTLKTSDQLVQEINKNIREIRSSREKNNEIGDKYGQISEFITKEELGVFGEPNVKDVIVRYSNGTPSNGHDKVPDARGMAIKILPKGLLNKPVEYASAQTINDQALLDILTINFPVFFVNDAAKYIKINEFFLESKKDNKWLIPAKWSEFKSIYFSGMNDAEIALALATNGSIINSPAFQIYHSMVPSRLGYEGKARAIKYEFAPVTCDPQQIEKFEADKKTYMPDWSLKRIFADPFKNPVYDPLKIGRSSGLSVNDEVPDYLRARMKEHLESGDICFTLKGDLYRDQINTNIEDSTDFWATSERKKNQFKYNVRKNMDFFNSKNISTFEEDYGYKITSKKIVPQVEFGRIRISKKFNEDANKNTKVCEDLSFNPWNGKLNNPYHKPLGVVSRMKRRVYQASRDTRHCLNQVGKSKDCEKFNK